MDFVCPITHETMCDPVVAQDGHTYERTAIERWFMQSSISPCTNVRIAKTLTPNYALRKVMEAQGLPLAPVVAPPTTATTPVRAMAANVPWNEFERKLHQLLPHFARMFELDGQRVVGVAREDGGTEEFNLD